MAVVVTGSAGFMGGHLVRALTRQGQAVVAVDRRPTEPQAGVRPIRADLADHTPAVRAALGDAEAVFHLAGRPGVRDSAPDVAAQRHRDNVLATRCVLAAVPLDVPLVVTSSSSVYGGSAGRPCHEDDVVAPRGGYAQSKVAVESACRERLDAGGVVGVARPFTVVGENQRADMALARWISAVAQCRPVTVYGGLHRTRDLTDVNDVVRGLLTMTSRRIHGVVNLGTGVGHPLGSILDAVCAVLGREALDLQHVVAPVGDVDATLADTRRCAALLGFVPTTDVRDVVARQVASAARQLRVPA